MDDEKIKAVNDALLNFVLRVASDANASQAEIQVLPEVAKVVLKILRPTVINVQGSKRCL